MDWINDYKTRWGDTPSYCSGEGTAMSIWDAMGPCKNNNPSTYGGGANFSGVTTSENSGIGEVRYIYNYRYDKPF